MTYAHNVQGKDEIFHCQAHTRSSTDMRERERDRDGQTDRQKERCFNETL